MDRNPVVAGQFYQGNPVGLRREVEACMSGVDAPPADAPRTLLAMVPHAGYMFSGRVCGRTLASANLSSTILMLGPNHTGRGQAIAVWPDGHWFIPGSDVPVLSELASRIASCHPAVSADTAAHAMEHSLEVILPFLAFRDPGVGIVPVAVSEHRFTVLEEVAAAIVPILAAAEAPVSIVVSSDMSHYVSRQTARTLDTAALDAAVALDPRGLYDVVRERGITMCGVLPMTLGLMIAKGLGAREGRLAAYATSGDVTGDQEQVVGYAGVLVH
ncbi:hypothetical protein GGQ74_000639 [Desulfobaculum xiamenense]|uniref:MEMO1 family protein GGQ74_000639 n=1 Tax=Desulfobaculum xiamenense TaxID=995050 RepID=A0A846QQR9_9BACT|nr:AmmeMemoRadiSam system protein B [Desulfobaculum xiamenense]NJB66999.1 hypothetical protein [Desulfobaculum xiamenense]